MRQSAFRISFSHSNIRVTCEGKGFGCKSLLLIENVGVNGCGARGERGRSGGEAGVDWNRMFWMNKSPVPRVGGEPGGESGESPVDWVRERLGFQADAAQSRVLASGSRRGILNCTRQWGKSTVTAAMAVHHAMTREESLVLVVSPSARQSGELLRKAEGFVGRLGQRAKGDGTNELSLVFPNGSRMVGLPGNDATVRGFSAVGLLLVDEASRVSDDLYRAVRPMLAVSGGTLWLMSTPNGKRGFFWEAWSGGGEDWERVQVTARECPRIPAKFLAEEERAMGDRWFRQEYLCEFGETAGALFSEEDLRRAIRDDVAPLEI